MLEPKISQADKERTLDKITIDIAPCLAPRLMDALLSPGPYNCQQETSYYKEHIS